MAFGKVVHGLRVAKALTLEELGKQIKKSKGYLSGIENEKVSPPTPKIVSNIAKALGVDASVLALIAYVEKAPKALEGVPTFETFKASVLLMTLNLNAEEKPAKEAATPPAAVPVESPTK